MKQHTFKTGKRTLTPCEPLQIWQPGKFNGVEYTVRFDETIRYRLPGEEKWDWLKGGGVSLDLFTNHRNSSMWGLRYNPDTDKVELNAYAHIDGNTYYTKWLVDLAINEIGKIKIYPGEGDIWITHFITDTKEVKIPWLIPNKALFYRRIKAWFGGTLPAPQDVNIVLSFKKY